ncbi:ABC transporter permease [Tamaricihabitans halophyticus]|uniref:ABC transporter permease n=1 Tax=Tamaricihabitans halophyticus TaxID=1262583 RepID=UPI00104EE447|nr:ABC transporter permease [Tamaricihabitans halophyticus]
MQLPWRAAARAAFTSPVTIIVTATTALLVAFVAVAAVLHSAAAGSAAVDYQTENLCAQAVPTGVDGQDFSIQDANTVIADARAQGAKHGFDTAIAAKYSSPVVVDHQGTPAKIKFAYRDRAQDNLRVVRGGDPNGIWISETMAEDFGMRLGDQLGGAQLPPVTAIYADLSTPTSQWWCSESAYAVPNMLAGDAEYAQVAWLPSSDDYDTAMSTTDDAGLTTLSVRFPSDQMPHTTGEAQAQSERNDALITTLTNTIDSRDLETTPSLDNAFERPTEVASDAQTTVFTSILSLTVISLLVGLAGVATVTIQWCQRRQSELRLLWSRGASPTALGLRAVLELAAPLAIGTVLGAVLARVLLPWYAPARAVDLWPQVLAGLAALGTLLIAIAVAGTTTLFWVHRRFARVPARPGRLRRGWRYVPWELLSGGLAVAAWARLSAGYAAASDGPVPTVDPAALAFPLLVLLTVVLLVARIAQLLLGRSHYASWWRVPAAQLAMRRLAASRGPAIGVLLVGALAVGALATGSGIANAQSNAMLEKSNMFIGANSSVQVTADTVVDENPIPKEVAGSSTLVGEKEDGDVTILAVDPEDFPKGAWLEGRTQEEMSEVLAPLRAQRQSASDPIPAIRVGQAPSGAIELPSLPGAETVAAVESFTKIGTNPGYVISSDVLSHQERWDMTTWSIWSQDSLERLSGVLNDAQVYHFAVKDREAEFNAMPFLVIEWTFGFVTALGLVLAAVAAVALLLAVEVRRRQNALSGTFLLRMGLRQRALFGSHLLELGALATAAVLTGVGIGATGAVLSVPLLDPAPWLNPIPDLPNLTPLVLASLAGGGLVVLLAGWVAVRAVRTASIGELIRG